MTSDEIASVIALVLLVIMSAYFSAAETAFSALNRIRVKNLAETGNKRAGLVLRLAEDYSTLLSTVLVGNNIVNIGATSIATVLFVGMLGGSVGPTVSTIVMTLVVLVFGEISPKTLAKERPEAFAMFAAPLLRVLSVLLTPVNWLFAQWKKLLAKLIKGDGGAAITEEELLTLVDEAEQEGAINEEDKDLIRNVIEFNDSRVDDIFTPRVDIEALPREATADEVGELFISTGYTRLPVYDGSIDRIVGVLHLHDWFEAQKKGNRKLAELITPVVYITQYTKISDLLHIFQRKKSHMAVVKDEYGGTMGLVTMEDILEELVGEIWDEHDEVMEEICQVGPGVYKVLGSADIDDVFQQLGLSGEVESSTVNGWLMERLGRIPKQGDQLSYEGVTVQVVKVENNRVEECLFRQLPAEEPGQQAE